MVAAVILSPISYRGMFAFGDEAIAQARCREYWAAVQTWARVKGRHPESLAEMLAPLRPGEPTFLRVETDPWGNPYVLKGTGDGLFVHSRGPDGGEGNDDDIVWPPKER